MSRTRLAIRVGLATVGEKDGLDRPVRRQCDEISARQSQRPRDLRKANLVAYRNADLAHRRLEDRNHEAICAKERQMTLAVDAGHAPGPDDCRYIIELRPDPLQKADNDLHLMLGAKQAHLFQLRPILFDGACIDRRDVDDVAGRAGRVHEPAQVAHRRHHHVIGVSSR